MDIESLRYVVTLAEELHFGRSAGRHYISEAQFGRRIRQIEAGLGVRIFERSSRHVEVTPAGAAVVSRARRVLAELDELRAGPGDRDRSGAFRVGVLGFGVGDRWGAIRDLVRSACPGLELVHRPLTLADQYEALLRREVDVALVHYLGDVDGLELQFVMETPRVAVVPASSPLALQERITDLDAHRWLRLSGADERFAAWVGSPAQTAKGPSVATLDTVTTAVATTGMLGVHGAAAAQFFAHPDVRFVPMAGAPVATAVATRRGDDRPAVEAFRTAARYAADRPGVKA